MQGEWTPYTELSPENLARAVWDALATQFNETGTMGSKLNTASSGGVDMGAMVDAVLAALNATRIPVDAVQGAWPTAAQNADAVWAKELP